MYDESLLPILGEPTEFEVIQPNPFDETNWYQWNYQLILNNLKATQRRQ
jgi:hypothetical protein